jgi:hypothetical protein
MNSNELSYINNDGATVFTSAYHKKRGTCCKSDCLHCPYGHTQKKYFIEIVEMKPVHLKFANEIIRDTKPVILSDVSMSLLASAFGPKEKLRVHHVTADNINNFAFGEFKGTICAVIEFSNRLSESSAGRSVKEIFLKKEFLNQGLGIEHIRV